jgi:tetratricopeptide (TPR) repeat protein
MVQVPVEKSGAPMNILSVEAELEAAERRRKRLVLTVVCFGVIGLGVAGYFWLAKRPRSMSSGISVSTGPRKPGVNAEDELRRSLLLYDLEGAKEALADLEADSAKRGRAMVPMGRAILKKEFLFDSESASASLLTARGLARDARTRNEVENLSAIYGFDKDPAASTDALRSLVKEAPTENIYKYNLAYAYLRQNKPQEALPVIASVVAGLHDDDPLYADAMFVQGWAQELDPKFREAAEASFLKAVAADLHQSQSRLALAIHRLRRSGLRAAEGDFRAFIDSAPELDPPSRILEYRKMNGPEFYNSARTWLRELNLDGPMGSKPSPLVMAVDAVLSCLQNRTGEAGKIIEGALASSNGDVNVLKAMGYHRWKEGRYAEIVEMFRDVTRDKMGFAVPYIMGKALLKLDRRPQAAKMFEFITANTPARSEGWALLGDLLLQEGKKVEAQAKLLNAIRKDPYNLVALRALNRLGQQEVFSDEIMGNLPF